MTTEKNEKVISLFIKGYSYVDIAREMGVTKNTIAGIIYRHNRKSGKKAVRADNVAKIRDVLSNRDFLKHPKHSADISGFKTVLENNTCRYIKGDIRAGTAEFCSNEIHKRGFCEYHYAKCFFMPDRKK